MRLTQPKLIVRSAETKWLRADAQPLIAMMGFITIAGRIAVVAYIPSQIEPVMNAGATVISFGANAAGGIICLIIS